MTPKPYIWYNLMPPVSETAETFRVLLWR